MYRPGPFRLILSILLQTVIARLAIAQDKVACIDCANCFIAAHDAFLYSCRTGEPGGDTWSDLEDKKCTASELSKIEQTHVGHNETYVYALPG